MKLLLVIDDEKDMRDLLKEYLEGVGYEVLTASGGIEGLKTFRSEPIDVVITDILMPDKDGLEVIQELRSEFSDVKIIAFSGGGRFPPEVIVEPAKHLGAVRALSKPFELEDLRRMVEEVIAEGGEAE